MWITLAILSTSTPKHNKIGSGKPQPCQTAARAVPQHKSGVRRPRAHTGRGPKYFLYTPLL